MIKAVIFDLDGTLADTIPDLQTAMNCMLIRLGYRTRTKAEILGALNNGSREFVRRSLPKDVQGVPFILESAIETYAQEYEKCYCEKTIPFEGIEALLKALRAKDIKLAVLSNKQDGFVKNIISELFDDRMFSVVQGQSSLPVKPDPTSTVAIIKKLGVKPHQCLFVGDSDVDMKTARNAKIKSVGVSWGYRSAQVLMDADADYIIHNPKSLIDIIEAIKQEEIEEKRRKKLEKKGENKSKKGKKSEKSQEAPKIKVGDEYLKVNSNTGEYTKVFGTTGEFPTVPARKTKSQDIAGVEDGTQISFSENDIMTIE